MSASSRNYHADNGDTWVIGGKLVVLPDASVEGLGSGGSQVRIEAVPDSSATKIAELRDDFNHLLAALREAGLMKEA